MKSLGIDVGSSSVKVSLLDVERNECIASATNPSAEMPITALKPGWAEQDPQLWWEYVCKGIRDVAEKSSEAGKGGLEDLGSIGISYQMHGFVPVDENGKVVRKAIIWCDSRAVEIGAKALQDLGEGFCLEHLLNSPGNFTASKAAWVKENEPELFGKISKFMLPGDYIAYRLSGEIGTSKSGLSEQILWDFKRDEMSQEVLDYYSIPKSMIPPAGTSLGIEARTDAETEKLLGIPQGVPISYRAGDQPNNAFSLNVMEAGEIAATGGTSGVVYGVTDIPKADPQSRVNTFLHVNHSHENPRYGILLCINGTGIMNSWIRRNIGGTLDYNAMNDLAASVPPGSEGLLALPFGNGAERVLGNRYTGASISGIDLNRHGTAHIIRAAHEGIAYSFRYGIDIMKAMGLQPDVIRAGRANLFLSPIFRQTLSTITGAKIELYNTDGALGAARGAALGAGLYSSREEAFSGLHCVETVIPHDNDRKVLEQSYGNWLSLLSKGIS